MAASRLVLVGEDSGHVLGRDAVKVEMEFSGCFVLEFSGQFARSLRLRERLSVYSFKTRRTVPELGFHGISQAARWGTVALADPWEAGHWSGDCAWHGLGLAGFRFPPEVIPVAVGWYLRYGLSSRDAEELLAERGITVDHVTIYRWAQRFTPAFIEAAGPGRHAPSDRWSADQTYLKAVGCGVPELGHGP